MADRAFAWLHVPGTVVHLGEVVLAIGVVLAALSPQLRRLLRYSPPIRVLVLFIGWGAVLTLLGLPDHGVDALRDGALWYYGLLALVVATLVLARPDVVSGLVPALSVLFVLFLVVGPLRLGSWLDPGPPFVPDSLVPIYSHRAGNIAVAAAMGAVFLVLLTAPWLRARVSASVTIGLVVAGVVGLLVLYVAAGTQARAGMIAGFVGIAVFGLIDRRFRPVLIGAAALAFAIGFLAYVVDFELEVGARQLSPRQFVENLQTSFDSDETTASMRLEAWDKVIDQVLTPTGFLTGFGFGENLGEDLGLAPSIDAPAAPENRHPHNSHLSVLGRMGVPGVALWVALWAAWFYQLVRARRRLEVGDQRTRADLITWAMVAAVAMLVHAAFDGIVESPQVAAWLWATFGLGAALAMEANLHEWQRRRLRLGSAPGPEREGRPNPLEATFGQLRRMGGRRRRRW